MTRSLDRADLQDRLPDYVHGTLPADEVAQLEAALASDADLARELDLVLASRAALTGGAVAIDAGAIVAALPRPGSAPGGLSRVSRWRVAAAIATIAVGGASLAVVQQTIRGDATGSLEIRGETTLAVLGDADLAVSFGYDLSMLNDDDLEELLADLEQAAGLPTAEPRRTVPSQDEGGGE